MESGARWAIFGLLAVAAILAVLGLEKCERCKSGDDGACRWGGNIGSKR